VSEKESEFDRIASKQPKGNLVTELWQFLSHNKKWWLLPIAVVLLAFGLLLLLSSSAVAPFIYTLF
jgi:hypothetical protein